MHFILKYKKKYIMLCALHQETSANDYWENKYLEADSFVVKNQFLKISLKKTPLPHPSEIMTKSVKSLLIIVVTFF